MHVIAEIVEAELLSLRDRASSSLFDFVSLTEKLESSPRPWGGLLILNFFPNPLRPTGRVALLGKLVSPAPTVLEISLDAVMPIVSLI